MTEPDSSGALDDLELERHGLTCAHRTLGGDHRFGDGTEIVIADTAEATGAPVRALSAHDADAWLGPTNPASVSTRTTAKLRAIGGLTVRWEGSISRWR